MTINLPHNSIAVSQNEIFSYPSLNSNFNKLIENDQAIYDGYKEMFSSLRITEYDSNKTDYQFGDLVWWQDKRHNNELYLLKNIIDDNPNTPYIPDYIYSDYEITQYLQQIGWYNENDKLTIVNLGVEQEISSMVESNIQTHQEDTFFHPFGKINADNINEKILKKDMSNISKDRDQFYFPNATYQVEAKSAVLKGYYRTYDNGVLEYDIIFKFGDDNVNTGNSNIFGTKSNLSANVTTIQNTGGNSTITRYDNRNYFYNAGNCGILTFKNESLSNYSKIGNLTQMNRNDFVNVYTAQIYFPKIFKNKNYMIFTNEIMSQAEYNESGDGFLVPSSNEIVFCNKTLESVTALNITFPNADYYQKSGYNTLHNGLAANSFHCKIIGLGE